MHNAVLKKAIVKVIGIAGITTVTSSLQAASFDCAKAATNIEKMICMDAILSKQDEQLAQEYQAVMAKIGDKESLKKAQHIWLKERRNACKDAMCLMQAYHERIAELNSLAMVMPSVATLNTLDAAMPSDAKIIEVAGATGVTNSISVAPAANLKPRYELTQGNQFQLCKDFLALINRVEKKPVPNCHFDYPFDEIAKKQGFKDIDWVEVNRKDYRDWLKNRYIYREYRVSENTVKERAAKFESFFDKSNTRMWAATFDLNGDGKKDKVFKEKTENCGVGSGGYAFIRREDGVLDDLEHRRTAANDLFLYQGKSYFYQTNYIGEWFGMDSYVTERGLCNFKEIQLFTFNGDLICRLGPCAI